MHYYVWVPWSASSLGICKINASVTRNRNWSFWRLFLSTVESLWTNSNQLFLVDTTWPYSWQMRRYECNTHWPNCILLNMTMIRTGSILFKRIIKVTDQLNHFPYNVTEAGEQKTNLFKHIKFTYWLLASILLQCKGNLKMFKLHQKD